MKTIRDYKRNGKLSMIQATVKASLRTMNKAKNHGWRIVWTGEGLFGIRKEM
jgi:hypothetical protein